MSSPNYVSLDHSRSFAGEADWVQAEPLKQTLLPSCSKHTATVILLHGFANSGAAWLPFAQYLAKALPYARFHLPNAPLINVHVPRGEAVLPAWWDSHLTGKPFTWEERIAPIIDQDGLKRSKETIANLIEQEVQLVGAGRVFLAGFSQGTALATAVGLEKDKIGGIIALSSWLPIPDAFQSETPSSATREKAVFWAHGKDDFLPYKFAENSVDYLIQKAGLRAITLAQKPEPGTVTFKLYDNLGHATKTEEVEDITRWQVVGHSVTNADTSSRLKVALPEV